MKKFILILWTFFMSICLHADNITVQKAQSVADRFLSTIIRNQKIKLSESPQARLMSLDNQTPDYYIFNQENGRGFVIVSANDCTVPILGWSNQNSFDCNNIPSNMEDWLQTMSQEIRNVKKLKMKASPAIQKMWKEPSYGNIIKAYKTAEWDQEEPFWNQCPMYHGENTCTGCVITATAIIMKYNQWPLHASGKTTAYTTPRLQIEVPERNLGTYNWNLMPDHFMYNHIKPEEATEVSKLMADLGALMQADYMPLRYGGTGAPTASIAKVLKEKMQYDKNIKVEYRSGYSDEEWNHKMKTELNSRPMIYSGFGEGGGHAFVVDGYTDMDYYHVNWGWSGAANGYYRLSAMIPDVYGAGANSMEFNNRQVAIMNMKKDEGSPEQETGLFMTDVYEDYRGISTSTSDIRQNVPFRLKAGTLATDGNLFWGDVYLAVADKNDNVKEILDSRNYTMSPLGEGFMEYHVFWPSEATITGPIEEGDKIKCFYMPMNGSRYIPVKGHEDNGIIMEIPLGKSSDDTIAQHTHIEFDRSTKTFTVTLPDSGISVSMKDEAGNDMTNHCVKNGTSVQICGMDLKKGYYKLYLSRGKETKKLTLKF